MQKLIWKVEKRLLKSFLLNLFWDSVDAEWMYEWMGSRQISTIEMAKMGLALNRALQKGKPL